MSPPRTSSRSSRLNCTATSVVAAPLALEREPPGARRDQVVLLGRPPRALLVLAQRRRILEQRRGDLPQPLDALGGGEERVVARHGVVNQALVGLEHLFVL